MTAQDLLKFLIQKFPERTPREPLTEWELGFEAGKIHIIDILKRELNYETEVKNLKTK